MCSSTLILTWPGVQPVRCVLQGSSFMNGLTSKANRCHRQHGKRNPQEEQKCENQLVTSAAVLLHRGGD